MNAKAETTTGRPHREPLTRERVIQVALEIMDREGVDAITMRHVGRALGVEAMSLYNHVKDKQDLLDGITGAVMAEFRWEPTTDDWVEQGRQAASEWRRLIKAHPNVMQLLVERKHPMASAEMLRPTEIALDILRRAGLSERDTVNAFQAIGGYIFGAVMMEIGNLAPGHSEVPAGPAELSREIASEFPCLAQLLPWFVECDTDATFELGLDLLLEGMRAKAASATGAG
ncbi:MAG TPA: TetR/AcrR family transcriptional regulator C-terminal domain-containing protein [Actinomycetota bacterium]|nr:TetR/AcrR family transcriptional regulator C-terminal domain-containing protein [Actinomycetota bacterium]